MNKWLVGNGYWCTACKGTGRGEERDMIEHSGGGYALFYDSCVACKGQRRIAHEERIVSHGGIPIMPTETPEPTCFLPIIEYGQLAKTGRLPRRRF